MLKKVGVMNPSGVGQEEFQAVINEWSEQNNITEFISAGEVSGNVLRRLRRLENDGLVWHQVLTNDSSYILMDGVDWFGPCEFCHQLEHLGTKCKGSKGLGWTTVGFYVANTSDPRWDEFQIQYQLFCALCNSDSSFESLDEACPSCEGEGSLIVDYQWPGHKVL
jgi:hypothetical protein